MIGQKLSTRFGLKSSVLKIRLCVAIDYEINRRITEITDSIK